MKVSSAGAQVHPTEILTRIHLNDARILRLNFSSPDSMVHKCTKSSWLLPDSAIHCREIYFHGETNEL